LVKGQYLLEEPRKEENTFSEEEGNETIATTEKVIT